MANLAKKDGIYLVRFRYQGKEYKKSLKTRNAMVAETALHDVASTILKLGSGRLSIPAGLDPGDFIASGGTVAVPAIPAVPAAAQAQTAPLVFPTTKTIIERYLAARQGEGADSYLSTQRTHLNHLRNFLGKAVDQPCNQVDRTTLENFLRARKKIRDGETVKRERMTLRLFYKWVALQSDIPKFPYPAEALPTFKGSRDPDPFKTVEEIEAVLSRGGLEEKETLKVWDCLYLDPPKIAGLLRLVKERATDPLSFLLHAIPAYTGMRRGEVLKLKWRDVDFDHNLITARSRKQSRTKQETSRRIDMHPDLKQHLLEWQSQRPKGQFVLSVAGTWTPINCDGANRLFWQPMRNTNWCLDSGRNWFKIGFHSYRHSFASNLAAAGVDQRLIDTFMGHQTEEMRRRYQHLFPNNRREAIQRLTYAAP